MRFVTNESRSSRVGLIAVVFMLILLNGLCFTVRNSIILSDNTKVKLAGFDGLQSLDTLNCTYATFLGGTNAEISDRSRFGIAVDENGNAVITGSTSSTDFPIMNAYQENHNGMDDAFLAKFSSDGSLLFSTYLGGSGNDYGTNIAIDSEGDIVVLGCTTSTNFPTTSSCYQSNNGGEQDIFLSKFSNSGSLLASTYLGGTESEWSYGLTLDSTGNVIIGGETFSIDMPLQDAYQATYEGQGDTFVSKLSENLQSLVFSTYLGGAQNEWWVDVATDSDNNIILNGASWSLDFPITDNALQDDINGLGDSIITKLSGDGQTLIFSTFLGGTQFDMGTGVAVDDDGNIALTGETSSYFPTMNAYQQVRGHPRGVRTAYVTTLNASGSMLFSTYLGGESEEMGYDAAFDEYGNIIIVGETTSASFPVVSPYQENHGGEGENLDVFVTAFNSDGGVLFSTFLGGSDDDSARGVSVDADGTIMLTGWTTSSDFPTVDAYQADIGGQEDILICSLDPGDIQTYDADFGDNTPESSTTTSTTTTSSTSLGEPISPLLGLLIVPIIIGIIVLVYLKRR